MTARQDRIAALKQIDAELDHVREELLRPVLREIFCNRLASEILRNLRCDQISFPGLINDGMLHLLDCHGLLIDSQHASRFARRRAEASRELWEVVGGMKAINCFG